LWPERNPGIFGFFHDFLMDIFTLPEKVSIHHNESRVTPGVRMQVMVLPCGLRAGRIVSGDRSGRSARVFDAVQS
jgi:hypothetical protein